MSSANEILPVARDTDCLATSRHRPRAFSPLLAGRQHRSMLTSPTPRNLRTWSTRSFAPLPSAAGPPHPAPTRPQATPEARPARRPRPSRKATRGRVLPGASRLPYVLSEKNMPWNPNPSFGGRKDGLSRHLRPFVGCEFVSVMELPPIEAVPRGVLAPSFLLVV